MTETDGQLAAEPGRRDWRPIVAPATFLGVRGVLIAVGCYWYYANRHSGDLVIRFEAVVLVLAGIWTGYLLRVRSPRR